MALPSVSFVASTPSGLRSLSNQTASNFCRDRLRASSTSSHFVGIRLKQWPSRSPPGLRTTRCCSAVPMNMTEEEIVVLRYDTSPIKGQTTGTSGLRKKTKVLVSEPKFLPNWIQSLFNALGGKPFLEGKTLVLGGDGRFYNKVSAQTIIRMAAANGMRRVIVGRDGILTTPAVSAMIPRRGAVGGIVLTASHNPAGPDGDWGIKYNTEGGAPALEGLTSKIYDETTRISEYFLADLGADVDLEIEGETSFGNGQFVVEVVNPVSEYLALPKTVFDFEAIKKFLARPDFSMITHLSNTFRLIVSKQSVLPFSSMQGRIAANSSLTRTMTAASKLKSLIKVLFIFLPLVGAACVACFFEALSYLVVRPISLTKHRQVCLFFSRAFLLSAPFILEHWANITFKGYGDRIDPAKSHFAVINHRSNIDWLLGLAYISRFGAPYPGNAKSVVKASLAKVPMFGYILKFAEFLFLTRLWATDKDQFLRGLEKLKGYSKTVSPMWMVLYPEGTRFSKQRHEHSTAVARAKGMLPTENVLLPRYKGFTSIVSVLRNEYDGIVDATFMFEGDEPDVKSALAGTCSSVVHCYMKYYPIEELPESEEELQKWLLDRWYEKDRIITAFHKDIQSLGPAIETSGKPSVALFYALVAVFQIAAATTIYAFSKIPNGLFFLFSVSLGAVAVTGLFVALNIRPSRRGPGASKKGQ